MSGEIIPATLEASISNTRIFARWNVDALVGRRLRGSMSFAAAFQRMQPPLMCLTERLSDSYREDAGTKLQRPMF